MTILTFLITKILFPDHSGYKKIKQACKPGSVPFGFYHLSSLQITLQLKQPTPQHRPGRSTALVYMVLQLVRRTAVTVARNTGGLLPHLFTLIPRMERLFSVTLLYPHEYLPVRKHNALRCPDFPLSFTGQR